MISKSGDIAPKSWRSTAIHITLIYAAIGALWILLSDRVTEALARDLAHSTAVQTIKGIGYVVVTAAILYWLVARAGRRDAELSAAVVERERRLREVLDSAPVAILTVQDGRIRYVNAAAQVLLNAPAADDLLGQPITKLFSAEDGEEILRDIAIASANHRCIAREDQDVTTLGGTELVCEMTISGRTYHEPDKACVVLIDRTERKRLEEALIRARLMETVGQMAAGVAHDFNNVLLVIQGHVDLLEQAMPEGNGARASLRRIEEAAALASGIATSLMSLARDTSWSREPVKIAEIVHEAGKLLQAALGRRITLEIHVDPMADVTVMADRTKLLQAVLNLAFNARDAMPDGGIVRISLSRLGDDRVALRVSDTGAGIAEEYLSRIFEPLFTTKPPGAGAGLGLTITRHIVEEFGGTIEVSSRPGAGSVFTILLPIAVEHPQPMVSRGQTVLLADGHDLIRPIIARMLRALGCDVIEASTGAGLLAKHEQMSSPVGLILLDDALADPPMGECLRSLRDRGVTAPALIVCSDAQAARDVAAGLEPFITLAKPFAIADLRAAVVEAMNTQQQAR